jgi:hypothetical protein
MIGNNKLYIQLFRMGRQKMPKCFYQRQNEQAINATHTHTHTHSLSLSLSKAHKVSDKIVLIFKKQLEFTRPMAKTDIMPHSYIFNFLASP